MLLVFVSHPALQQDVWWCPVSQQGGCQCLFDDRAHVNILHFCRMGLEAVGKTASQFFLPQPPLQGVGGVISAQLRRIVPIEHIFHGVTEDVGPTVIL